MASGQGHNYCHKWSGSQLKVTSLSLEFRVHSISHSLLPLEGFSLKLVNSLPQWDDVQN